VSFAQLENFIFEKISETKLPGLSIALIQDGKLHWSRDFGLRDVESGLAATPHTLYSVGSITKSFTTIGIMQLAEQGKLHVDDPIEKYMPFDIRPGGETVRIWHLMSHTSGIPALAYAENIIDATTGATESWLPIGSVADILTFLQNAGDWALDKPGERWFYLNEGYMLLGAIIEQCSGMVYEDYIRQNILKPLGMDRSVFRKADVEADPDVATPYVNWAQQGRLRSQYPYSGLAPVGGLFSNVLDLGQYVAMYLNQGTYGEQRLLSAQSIADMTVLRVATPVKNSPFGNEGYGYGLGIKSNFLGHKLIGHSGSIGVATAYMGFIPDSNAGVVLLTNGSGYPTVQFGLYALALLLGEDPEQLPFVRSQRLLAKIEGVYETYKGTMRWQVKRAGDFLMIVQQDKHNTQTVPLIPETLDDTSCLFYTLNSGNRFDVEFRLQGTQIELIYERYLLRRTGKLP
jgi:CubicO group peptidase (beta-lactamase class C family)